MSISASPVNQAVASWSSGSSFPVTITAPTNGNALILCYEGGDKNTFISSISQTGAIWLNAVTSRTGRIAEIWYSLNVSGAGTTVTVNLTTGSPLSNAANVSEWSGIATSGALDATGGNSATSTTPTSASITPTASREALIVCSSRVGGAVSAGPTNGFTGLTSADGAVRGYEAYLVVASTSGSYSTGWTAGSGLWETAIATFLAPPTGATINDHNFHGGGRGMHLGMRRGLSYHNQPQISAEERRFLAEERAKRQNFIERVGRAA